MEPCSLQCLVASMIESLYWIGIDQPANGTIFPAHEAIDSLICRTNNVHLLFVKLHLQMCRTVGNLITVDDRAERKIFNAVAKACQTFTSILNMEVVQGSLFQGSIIRKASGQKQLGNCLSSAGKASTVQAGPQLRQQLQNLARHRAPFIAQFAQFECKLYGSQFSEETWG